MSLCYSLIWHAVLTAKFSHTIASYYQLCRDTNYEPLSDSSLRFIPYDIKPSQQKSLSGLNGKTAAAINGLNYIQTVAQKYGNRYVKTSLDKGKRYLKSRYEMNCNSTNSSVSSHCVSLALSDPTANSMQEIVEIEKNNVCQDCHNLHNAIAVVYDIAKENLLDQSVVYDINIAVKDILE